MPASRTSSSATSTRMPGPPLTRYVGRRLVVGLPQLLRRLPIQGEVAMNRNDEPKAEAAFLGLSCSLPSVVTLRSPKGAPPPCQPQSRRLRPSRQSIRPLPPPACACPPACPCPSAPRSALP